MVDCDDRSIVNNEIQAFENDRNTDVYRFNIIQHPAIAIHSFIKNQ